MIKQKIEEALRTALPGVNFVVERPRDMSHGDYSTNAALVSKTDPQALVGTLSKIEGVGKVDVAGKFINIWLSPEALLPKNEPLPQPNAGKTIMVEYTDPNPFKEFHIGHLMSNAIGESVARLLEATGAKVLRVNYQGDVGPHVAKAIWAIIKKHGGVVSGTYAGAIGEAYVEGTKEYDKNPGAKKEIDEINQKIYERSDPLVNSIYDAGRSISLLHFEDIYKILGTTFNYYFFESESAPKGLALIKAHPEVFEESDGATVFHGEHTRVFVTSLGLPTYETKDLGLLQLKKEKAKFDQSITVTASEQSAYFKVVLAAATRISEVADVAAKTSHVSHGMMRFASGKMSSRTGNVVTGESLIADLTEGARGRQDVAVGAVKYAVLKSASHKDIIFDPEKSLSLEGDSGPYVQYACVRAAAVLRKAADAREVDVAPADKESYTAVARVLVHFPDIVARAALELEPHYLTTYLTELAAAFNKWYGVQQFIVDGQILKSHADMIRAVERTLTAGLDILGIPIPEEM
ncbi:MAG: arginine--tRNA ligase [Patescibacteria group bacterium]|nr:arginine--tRNA ligase [Patescibacteria group bacterium]